MNTTFSHRLRNSISAILAASQSLLDDLSATQSEQVLLIQAIQRSCQSMINLLNAELGVKAGRSKSLQYAPTELMSLVRHRLALKSPEARHRKVQLKCVNDFETETVSVEAPEIDLLLDEWISNALNVARPGTTVEIQVGVKAGQLMMSVYNTSAGEEQSGASQARQRRKGLIAATIDPTVLSVVTQVIENYRGHLQIESGSGMGPRLTVRLPLTRMKPQEGAGPTRTSTP
jgi:signal transduction histidine kinase